MSERKRELKKWLIDNPLDPDRIEAAAARTGLAPVTLRCYLSKPTMPRKVHEEFVNMGIPVALLPRQTQTKEELIAENRTLRRRLSKYEPDFKVEPYFTSSEARM